MENELATKAIQAALERDWKKAIELNLAILKHSPKDLDSLNRLGRAYLETGHKTKAEETYNKVLKIDKFNSIAIKSLDLLKTTKISHLHKSNISTPMPIFLEEPGVTKTVALTRLSDPKIISRLRPGDSVSIVAREHCVSIVSTDGQHLGRLPDDLASKMHSFLKAGNQYHAWIRSIESTPTLSLKIFIKEIFRATKFRNTPSFPVTEKLTYAAFTPPELIHAEKPVIGDEREENIDPEAELDNQDDDSTLPPPTDD
jgi:hypothetical protein